MKARIERNFANRMVSVWFYELRENGSRLLRILGDDVYEWVELENGGQLPEPSLRIPEEALQELIREASNILPVEDATTAHLKDAIKVRDRVMDAFLPSGES